MSDNSNRKPGDQDPSNEQSAANSAESFFSDLAALRLDEAGASAGAVEVLTHVPVRKPNKHEFFRVHPEFVLATRVFEDKEDNEFYMVMPRMRSELVGQARPVLLVPAITRQQTLFIWPMFLPGEDGRRDSWAETRKEAMGLAKQQWVRLQSDMALGAYRIYLAEGQLSDPVWPEKPFEELLEIAFRHRVIKNEDHPIVRRLRGLA